MSYYLFPTTSKQKHPQFEFYQCTTNNAIEEWATLVDRNGTRVYELWGVRQTCTAMIDNVRKPLISLPLVFSCSQRKPDLVRNHLRQLSYPNFKRKQLVVISKDPFAKERSHSSSQSMNICINNIITIRKM